MNWVKVPLLAVVVAPWRASDSQPAPQTAPTVITASVMMSLDPASRSCIPSIVVGLNTNANAELVVAWSEIGKIVPSLDGDMKDASGDVPLPWWSLSRRLSFDLPTAEVLGPIRDIRLVSAVRISVGMVPTTYIGDTYFSILDQAHVWEPVEMVLSKTTDAALIARVAQAEAVVTEQRKLESARRAYARNLRLLGESAPENQQPHIGPSSGLHLTFVAPQAAAPSAPIQVTIESASVEGPTHGNDPLQVWMWIQEDTLQNRVCADPVTLNKVDAFYKHLSVPPSVIPVPYAMDVVEFKADKMKFAAGKTIRVFALIQERYGTPARVGWRLSFGSLLTVPALTVGGPNQDLTDIVNMCPEASASPPQ